MQPRGASKNIVDQAIFSNEGQNLRRPEETNNPNVIPNMYRLKNRKKRGIPRFNIEIPNNGVVKIIAGTRPIIVLKKAVNIKDVIISLIFIGAINKLVKFLL